MGLIDCCLFLIHQEEYEGYLRVTVILVSMIEDHENGKRIENSSCAKKARGPCMDSTCERITHVVRTIKHYSTQLHLFQFIYVASVVYFVHIASTLQGQTDAECPIL